MHPPSPPAALCCGEHRLRGVHRLPAHLSHSTMTVPFALKDIWGRAHSTGGHFLWPVSTDRLHTQDFPKPPDAEVVILIGNTGYGKSTVTNLLRESVWEGIVTHAHNSNTSEVVDTVPHCRHDIRRRQCVTMIEALVRNLGGGSVHHSRHTDLHFECSAEVTRHAEATRHLFDYVVCLMVYCHLPNYFQADLLSFVRRRVSVDGGVSYTFYLTGVRR